MEKLTDTEKFDIEKSPLKEAYVLLGAKTPLELSNFYTEEDQELIKKGEWDYKNPNLIVNRVKEILEVVNPDTLSEDEVDWREEILWFWYHHAISAAIWRHNDKEAAKTYAKKALEHQTPDHPNQITKLLDLLVNNKIDDAEKHAQGIIDQVESQTAKELIEDYKDGKFWTEFR